MGFMDTLTKLFKKESGDLKDILSDAGTKANANLDRKEREMAMTPEEKMAQIQSEIGDRDPMAEMRDKIEHKSAKAETVEEMSAAEATRGAASAADMDGDDTIIDPEIIDAEVISDSADHDTGPTG